MARVDPNTADIGNETVEAQQQDHLPTAEEALEKLDPGWREFGGAEDPEGLAGLFGLPFRRRADTAHLDEPTAVLPHGANSTDAGTSVAAVVNDAADPGPTHVADAAQDGARGDETSGAVRSNAAEAQAVSPGIRRKNSGGVPEPRGPRKKSAATTGMGRRAEVPPDPSDEVTAPNYDDKPEQDVRLADLHRDLCDVRAAKERDAQDRQLRAQVERSGQVEPPLAGRLPDGSLHLLDGHARLRLRPESETIRVRVRPVASRAEALVAATRTNESSALSAVARVRLLLAYVREVLSPEDPSAVSDDRLKRAADEVETARHADGEGAGDLSPDAKALVEGATSIWPSAKPSSTIANAVIPFLRLREDVPAAVPLVEKDCLPLRDWKKILTPAIRDLGVGQTARVGARTIRRDADGFTATTEVKVSHSRLPRSVRVPEELTDASIATFAADTAKALGALGAGEKERTAFADAVRRG